MGHIETGPKRGACVQLAAWLKSTVPPENVAPLKEAVPPENVASPKLTVPPEKWANGISDTRALGFSPKRLDSTSPLWCCPS